MEQDNKSDESLDEVIARFPILDFNEPKKKKTLTLEELLKEYPVLDYDYGTVAYFARKYPLLPDEAHVVLEEQFTAQKKHRQYINDEQTPQ